MNVFTNNNAIRSMVAVWADTSRPVTRRVYLQHGLVLAAVKYLGDAALVYTATGTLWTPAAYLLLSQPSSESEILELAPVLAIWMLPFVAIGVTLSARRATDAGGSPWVSILFLVPYLNYVLMAALSALPARSWKPAHFRPNPPKMSDWAARILAGAAGVLVAVAAVALGVSALRSYGGWLFLLTPFAVGASTGYVYNLARGAASRGATGLIIFTVVVAGTVMLLVSIEGLVCLVMALPIAVPLAILGGVIGRWAATTGTGQTSPAMFMLLAVPLTAVLEPPSGHVLHEVRSSVVIEAPPDAVWPHVVAFREIPEPLDWVFRAGVAYPIRARLEGQGVGAVRYCVFSTGSFVEPITRWEPGRRLSFDVAASPPTMRELSPYRNLSPPHLHGYLRSKRGEFRLVDLGNGRTRLEGSTWYELEMAPEAYWQIFSDALIHRIHLRVLDHVKQDVEQAATVPRQHERADLRQPRISEASSRDAGRPRGPTQWLRPLPPR